MATVLLIAAILLPIVLFWWLRSRARLSGLSAASAAVLAGWALSIAWAVSSDESLVIAGAFGWICPTVLVALTGLAWHFMKRRTA